MSRDFRTALAQADRALEGKPVPAGLQARLSQRAGRRHGRALLVAAVVAAAGALLAFWLRGRATPELGGFAVASASPDLQAELSAPGEVSVRAGRCTLVDARWRGALELAPASRVRREADGVRVLRGTVHVSVEKRPAGAPPVRMLVSHGAIEVMGTRFSVTQRLEDGEVTLEEGAIRFVQADGEIAQLRPGQSLRWPRPAAAAPAQEQAPPGPAPSAPTPAQVRPAPASAPALQTPTATPALEPPEAILERVAALRSRNLYAQAAAELARALGRTDLSPAALERLDFELGSILSDHLGESARACAHWRAHRRKFPAGRYDREIERIERRLGCANPDQEPTP